MEQKAKRTVVGRASRVEFCHCGDSVILSVGAVTLRLDTQVAEDVAATIACALSLDRPARSAAFAGAAATDGGPGTPSPPVDGETN